MEFSAICRFSVDSFTELPIDRMAVSSAKVAVVKLASVGTSLVYKRYRIGSSMLTYGTPAAIGLIFEYASSYLTRKKRSLR